MFTIARKEFTRGEVIGILGQVVGKSIEAVGVGILLGARTLSVITKGLFFISGKQVDMVDTLKEIAHGNGADQQLALEDAQYSVIEQTAGPVLALPGNEILLRGISLIRLALEYSTRAYGEKMLPIEEVLRVDHQAQIMAKAVQQYLRKHEGSLNKKNYNRLTSTMVDASTLFGKYHRTGNEQYRNDAVRMLEEAGDLMRNVEQT